MSMLENTDAYLKAQPKNHRLVFYVAVVIAVIFFGYLFVLSDMMDEVEEGEVAIQEQEAKLKKIKNPLKFTKLKIIKKKIKKTEDSIKQKEVSIEEQTLHLKQISLTNINDSSFAVFLEKLLEKTKRLNIKAVKVKVSSTPSKYIGKLDVKKELLIQGNGRFLNVLKLLRYAEEQKFLIKLQSLKMQKVKIKKDEKEKVDLQNIVFIATFKLIGVAL